MTGIRARPIHNGARVGFRLSERARVVVSLELGGLTVRTAGRTFRADRRSVTVRDPRLRGRRLRYEGRDATVPEEVNAA